LGTALARLSIEYIGSQEDAMHSTSRFAALAAAAVIAAGCGVMRGHESASAYVDDATLTARVKTALLKSPDVKGSEVNVQTYEGKVTLSGVVDNTQMARNAERITRETPGVKSVESAIQVASTAATEGSVR
jgi:osmotically-inducible protein OsmY